MTDSANREMQLFLLGFIIIEICEIFTVGGFPLAGDVRRGFTAVHMAAVTATTWVLMVNGIVGYQLIEDGTPMSLGLVMLSATIFFIGTGYIALDTGFNWTGFWNDTLVAPNRSYSLYTLYFLAPLVFISIFFLLETYLVLRILGEKRPMGACSSKRFPSFYSIVPLTNTLIRSLSLLRWPPLRNRSDLPVRRQCAHLQWHKWEDQRWPLRDTLHPSCRWHDLGILEQHHRRRLAHARNSWLYMS